MQAARGHDRTPRIDLAGLRRSVDAAAWDLANAVLAIVLAQRQAKPSKRDVSRVASADQMFAPKPSRKSPAGGSARAIARRARFQIITARTRAARAEIDAFIADAPADPVLDALPVMLKLEPTRPAPVLDDETIDHYMAKAADTVREVVESTASSFQVPASARGLVMR